MTDAVSSALASTDADQVQHALTLPSSNTHRRQLRLRLWELREVVGPGWYVHAGRYVFTPRGGRERVLTGQQLDLFLDGLATAWYQRRAEELQRQVNDGQTTAATATTELAQLAEERVAEDGADPDAPTPRPAPDVTYDDVDEPGYVRPMHRHTGSGTVHAHPRGAQPHTHTFPERNPTDA